MKKLPSVRRVALIATTWRLLLLAAVAPAAAQEPAVAKRERLRAELLQGVTDSWQQPPAPPERPSESAGEASGLLLGRNRRPFRSRR